MELLDLTCLLVKQGYAHHQIGNEKQAKIVFEKAIQTFLKVFPGNEELLHGAHKNTLRSLSTAKLRSSSQGKLDITPNAPPFLVILAIWLKKSPFPFVAITLAESIFQFVCQANSKFNICERSIRIANVCFNWVWEGFQKYHIVDRLCVLFLGSLSTVLQAIKAFQDTPSPYLAESETSDISGMGLSQRYTRTSLDTDYPPLNDILSRLQTLSCRLSVLCDDMNGSK